MDLSSMTAIASVMAAVGQVVAAAAVIVTILLVTRQLRHSMRELRTASFHGDVANVIAINSLFISNPEFSDLYLKAQRDLSTLSSNDRLRLHLFFMTVFRHYDNLYSQYRTGTLDAELWSGWERTFLRWLTDHQWKSWFDENSQYFSSPLAALVQKLGVSPFDAHPNR